MMCKSFYRILFLVSVPIRVMIAQGDAVTLSPANPVQGDEIVLTYNPDALNAKFHEAKGIYAEAMLMKTPGVPPSGARVLMKQLGNLYQGSFKLVDSNSCMILFRFYRGTQEDNNGGKSWSTMVYRKDGKPRESAHYLRASMLLSGKSLAGTFARDTGAAKAELAKERELYPTNYDAAFMEWALMMRELPRGKAIGLIRKDLEKLYAQVRPRKELLHELSTWCYFVGLRAKGDAIRDAAIARNPSPYIVSQLRRDQIYAEVGPRKRIAMMERFLAEVPQEPRQKAEDERRMRSWLVEALVNEGKYDEAIRVLDSMGAKSGFEYNEPAWRLIERGEQLEKATAWAKKGVDLLRRGAPDSISPFGAGSVAKEMNGRALAAILDTYGYGLLKLGRIAEAEVALEEAYTLNKGSDRQISQRLLECLLQSSKFERVISLATECVERGKSSKRIVELRDIAIGKLK